MDAYLDRLVTRTFATTAPRVATAILRTLAGAAALGLCLLAGLVPAGDARPSPGERASSSPPLGGVNIPGLYPGVPAVQADRELAAARRLRAGVVRVGVPWSVLQPLGADRLDPRALAFTDRLVSDALADRIQVIMTVDSTPCWASSAPASLLRKCAVAGSSTAHAWPPSDPATYAAIVGYLARRYGAHLAAIEVWNEPDHVNQIYFTGPDKPRRYAAILRSAYPAIKRANPAVRVLAGSLVGSNGVFLRALYAAGIKGYYDGLAVHYYHLTLGSLRSIREVQIANGDSKPLWLDEFGWSSCYPRRKIQEEQACVTTQVQARNLTDTFRSLARTPYVAAEVVYDLQSSGHEEFGVLSASGARKPSFTALSRVLVSPFGGVHAVTLSLSQDRRGGAVVASGSGPVGDFMGLEVFQGTVLRYRALFVLDRFNRYSLALPRVLGTSGLRVRAFQYWAGSGAGAEKSI